MNNDILKFKDESYNPLECSGGNIFSTEDGKKIVYLDQFGVPTFMYSDSPIHVERMGQKVIDELFTQSIVNEKIEDEDEDNDTTKEDITNTYIHEWTDKFIGPRVIIYHHTNVDKYRLYMDRGIVRFTNPARYGVGKVRFVPMNEDEYRKLWNKKNDGRLRQWLE